MPSDNLDVFVRHQIYVEGYKNGLTEDTESLFEEIAAVILLLLATLGYERLSQVPKRELNTFIATVSTRVTLLFDRNPAAIAESLKRYIAVELKVQGIMLKALGHPVAGRDADRLATETLNAPIAAAGIQPLTVMPGIRAVTLAGIAALIRQAYANNWTPAEFTRALVGTKNKQFRDGIIAKYKRQFNTGINTIIQHTSSYINMTLGAALTDRYQWVSILDSATSDVCRHRAGRIYFYGQGPRPPAHYNCRSTTIPVFAGPAYPVPTYLDWWLRQPRPVAVDILGRSRADALRDGNLTATDLQRYDGMRPLTLEQFEASSSNIILGV